MKLKITLSFIALSLAVTLLLLLPGRGGDEAGTITVKVYDSSSVQVVDADYTFDGDDTLYTVLNEHHDLRVSGSKSDLYGRVFLGIDDVVTDFNTTFIYIEIDGEEARHGIDYLPLYDGAIYTFTVKTVD